MMTSPDTGWGLRAKRLADLLTERGDLHDPAPARCPPCRGPGPSDSPPPATSWVDVEVASNAGNLALLHRHLDRTGRSLHHPVGLFHEPASPPPATRRAPATPQRPHPATDHDHPTEPLVRQPRGLAARPIPRPAGSCPGRPTTSPTGPGSASPSPPGTSTSGSTARTAHPGPCRPGHPVPVNQFQTITIIGSR